MEDSIARVVLQDIYEAETSYLMRFRLEGIPISIVRVESDSERNALLLKCGGQLCKTVMFPANANANFDAAIAIWSSCSRILSVKVPKFTSIIAITDPVKVHNKPKLTIPATMRIMMTC
ncbi:hypothetical protein KP509_20G080600 [Ceratopteris richardii]|uniref:Uncharacterized protein n=1 Tax=Ceratopteris richardii TaxID=49495 RepID=A0A8T2SIK2_CERRI|nr:hypothetical protein KP509_20G080600 [Ceratopteris richardii]